MTKSLQYERLMSKDVYGTETVDPELEAEHIAQFENKMYSKRGFCWVDLEVLFQGVSSYSEFMNVTLKRETWGPPKRYAE